MDEAVNPRVATILSSRPDETAATEAYQSQMARLVVRLIEKLYAPRSEHIARNAPRIGTPPPNQTADYEPLFAIMETTNELMQFSQQCHEESETGLVWDDEVLFPTELDRSETEAEEPLLRQLRRAKIRSTYNILKAVPFHLEETSIAQLIFLVETRLHLFCYKREWLRKPMEEHATAAEFPSLRSVIPSKWNSPFLQAPLTEILGIADAISAKWHCLNTSEAFFVDLDELQTAIYWLYSKAALFLNLEWLDSDLDLDSMRQQTVDGEDEAIHRFRANLPLLNVFSGFFDSVFRDLELLSMLQERNAQATPDSLAYKTSLSVGLVEFLRHTLKESIVDDDLVRKWVRNLAQVAALADIGKSLPNRVSQVDSTDQNCKSMDEVMERCSDNPFTMETVWCFALSYTMRQFCSDLDFVDYLYIPRLDPKELLNPKPLAHPLILRIPLENKYVVLIDRTTCVGACASIGDAFLIWLWYLHDRHSDRVRHQKYDTVWQSLNTLRTNIEAFQPPDDGPEALGPHHLGRRGYGVFGASSMADVQNNADNRWARLKQQHVASLLRAHPEDGALFYDDTPANVQAVQALDGVTAVLVNYADHPIDRSECPHQIVPSALPVTALSDHFKAFREPDRSYLLCFDFDRTLLSCHTGGTPVLDAETGTLRSEGGTKGGVASATEVLLMSRFLRTLIEEGHSVYIVTRGIQSKVQDVMDALLH